MNNSQLRFQEVFDELATLSIPDKIVFLEHLLFYFTITTRAIWSDDDPDANEKVDALKWLNELSHRIWNIRFELQGQEEDNSIRRLYENMKFYGEQSNLLQMHLVPAALGAFENFKGRHNS